MVETGSISAHLDPEYEKGLSDPAWLQEPSFKSSAVVRIEGLVAGEPKGGLFAQLIVRREFDENAPGLFREKDRFLRLTGVDVHPDFRGRGLGTAMLSELERIARRSGFLRIEGIISGSSLDGNLNLPEFYKNRGFTVERMGSGYKFTKPL